MNFPKPASTLSGAQWAAYNTDDPLKAALAGSRWIHRLPPHRRSDMKNQLAIDPGANGGLAWIDREGIVHAVPMPDTDGDLVDLLRSIVTDGCECATIELVGGFIGRPQPGAAMFQFGFGAGFIRGVLMTLCCPIVMVRPQKWQKQFSLGTKSTCSSATEWKNKLKSEAQRRFPRMQVTLKTADALLLLEYAKISKEISIIGF